jgi:PBP1b-binding outer membrane lipoprotein LpoB
MRKLLSTLAAVMFVAILLTGCTEENVQPSAEKINNTSNATIRD